MVTGSRYLSFDGFISSPMLYFFVITSLPVPVFLPRMLSPFFYQKGDKSPASPPLMLLFEFIGKYTAINLSPFFLLVCCPPFPTKRGNIGGFFSSKENSHIKQKSTNKTIDGFLLQPFICFWQYFELRTRNPELRTRAQTYDCKAAQVQDCTNPKH